MQIYFYVEIDSGESEKECSKVFFRDETIIIPESCKFFGIEHSIRIACSIFSEALHMLWQEKLRKDNDGKD